MSLSVDKTVTEKGTWTGTIYFVRVTSVRGARMERCDVEREVGGLSGGGEGAGGVVEEGERREKLGEVVKGGAAAGRAAAGGWA